MWRYNEYLSNVQRALKDLGSICQRCVLRFGGVKSSREHKNITITDDVADRENICAKSKVHMHCRGKGIGDGELR